MTDPKLESRKILKKLFKNANGDAADAIVKYQGRELPNFGIMYPDIKNLSEQYPKHNGIAAELIIKNTREARIIAMLLVDVPKLDEQLLRVFIKQSVTGELKNHLARHVLAPFLKCNSWQKLSSFVDVQLAVKTFVQYFRMNAELPAFDKSVKLLSLWLNENYQPSMDGPHLAEAIYRCFPAKRADFKAKLFDMQNSHPGAAAQIQNWIDDFQYVENN
ncbi:hypothetical protein L21SP5_01782 [Salinivirga cyanobacteriivorans]|uniref:DNA alkylation repair enzyme n=1 Tax=Salinivirga cyanobacteriivorans TaxID=1307839 RepID=A0A0S2HZD2_9BACT|nr:DNA alkylation repair protein [Salinivirga cyanobacteriivorans]ALO15424.1 hypothetical protein L21SP5_01782 [Salinivirga cyanobacteriivorans]